MKPIIKRISKSIQAFIADEEGTLSLEYAIFGGTLVMVITASLMTMATALGGVFESFATFLGLLSIPSS